MPLLMVLYNSLLEKVSQESVDGISSTPVSNALPPILAQKIRSVGIENLIVHHNEQSYDTGLKGRYIPT